MGSVGGVQEGGVGEESGGPEAWLSDLQKQQNPHSAGFDVEVVGRGNLNLDFILLIFIINISLVFLLEYQLEYLAK